MANKEQLAEIKNGLEAWSNWRKDHNNSIHMDLSDTTFGRPVYYEKLPSEIIHHRESEYHPEQNPESALLSKANFQGTDLQRCTFQNFNLRSADFRGANLRNTTFITVNLLEADFSDAHLEGVHFEDAHLEKTNFARAYLEGASFERVTLSDDNGVGPRLIDVHWGDTNLSDIEWWQIDKLGEEAEAQKLDNRMNRRMKLSGDIYGDADVDRESKIAVRNQYEEAARTYRQLAKIFQDQGLYDNFVQFTYRAQVVDKRILRLRLAQSLYKTNLWFRTGIQRKERTISLLGQYLFSVLLNALAGYGYRPGRAFAWYLGSIFGFALLYWLLGGQPPLEAFVLSLIAFHGGGFLPNSLSTLNPGNLILIFTALETILGLFIEISFIATFTQRFFGR